MNNNWKHIIIAVILCIASVQGLILYIEYMHKRNDALYEFKQLDVCGCASEDFNECPKNSKGDKK